VSSNAGDILGLGHDEIRGVVEAMLAGRYLAAAGIPTEESTLEAAALIILDVALPHLQYPPLDANARKAAALLLEERALELGQLDSDQRFEACAIHKARQQRTVAASVAAALIAATWFEDAAAEGAA
jgi:hypothetical protein